MCTATLLVAVNEVRQSCKLQKMSFFQYGRSEHILCDLASTLICYSDINCLSAVIHYLHLLGTLCSQSSTGDLASVISYSVCSNVEK